MVHSLHSYYATKHRRAVSKLVLIASTGTDNKFRAISWIMYLQDYPKEDLIAFDKYAADTHL